MKSKTYGITITAIFSALICIMSMINIPVGTIPVSMANFAILLTALVLDTKKSVSASLVYILLGFCGLPVFSGFMGGVQALAGVTGGYILSYPVMCLFIGFLKKYIKKSSFLLCAISLIICYMLGTLQFMIITETKLINALSICVLPFVIFDIIKATLAVIVSKKLKKYIK